ncbi:MAG: DHA1 family bicyclomycin/chloramphenicol resistance-like MFS transporter [Alphaproteobacteria bacterium]|jgi:DHA1 family bicyclomycin/chloramphenicol resistance-like MFS transporter
MVIHRMSTLPAPPRYIFPLLAAITFIAPLAVHMMIPALQAIQTDLKISQGLAQATLALVMVVMAFSTIVYGGLSDQWGRKPVLLGGLALYVIGSELSYIAPDIWTLLAGRTLQGIGAGCGVVLARAIARDVYGMERVAQVIAYLTTAYVLGPLVAPPLAALMLPILGWRFLFLIPTVLGLALIAVALFQLPETHRPTAQGMGLGRIITSTFSTYVRLLRIRRFTAFALVPGLESGAFFANAAASPFLAMGTLGISPAEYALWFLFLPIGFMTGNFISARIGNRQPIERMTLLGTIICFAVVILQAVGLVVFGLSMEMLMMPMTLIGIGQGLCLPYAQAGTMQIDPAYAGSASGAVTFGQLFFAGVAQQIVGLIADGSGLPMVAVMLCFSSAALIAAIVAMRSK